MLQGRQLQGHQLQARVTARPPPHDTPLALIGYPPAAARALRDLGLCAVSTRLLPGRLPQLLEACLVLGYSGALVHPGYGAPLLDGCAPDTAAQRAGEVDALAFVAGPLAAGTVVPGPAAPIPVAPGPAAAGRTAPGTVSGTHTLADALIDALDGSGYPVRGARALLIGQGDDLRAGLALTRLGLRSVMVAAGSRPAAEALARDLSAGVLQGAVARSDPALITLAERADLIILTAGTLPAGVLQPFHALLDLTGRSAAAAQRAGATLVPLTALPALRLARQLLHATGQRFTPEALEAAARALG